MFEVKQITDAAKALLDMAITIPVAEKQQAARESVLLIRDAFMDERETKQQLREELHQVRSELEKTSAELGRLKTQIADESKYHIEQGMAWAKDDNGKPTAQPLCATCMTKGERTYLLRINPAVAQCPSCRQPFRPAGGHMIFHKYQKR